MLSKHSYRPVRILAFSANSCSHTKECIDMVVIKILQLPPFYKDSKNTQDNRYIRKNSLFGSSFGVLSSMMNWFHDLMFCGDTAH